MNTKEFWWSVVGNYWMRTISGTGYSRSGICFVKLWRGRPEIMK